MDLGLGRARRRAKGPWQRSTGASRERLSAAKPSSPAAVSGSDGGTMKTSAWNATLLTALLLAPSGFAKGDEQQPPSAPVPPAAPGAPEAPIPPAPPAPRARTKRVVVASPEKQVVVDGDRVLISGDDEDVLADLDGFDAWDGHSL